MKNFFRLFFLLLILTACESQIQIDVTCIDSRSKQVVPGVEVQVNAGLDGDYTKSTSSGLTDSVGKFNESMMIGCAFGCYDVFVTYTKYGYHTHIDSNIWQGTVYLDPLD